jgi:hypothetical protein
VKTGICVPLSSKLTSASAAIPAITEPLHNKGLFRHNISHIQDFPDLSLLFIE